MRPKFIMFSSALAESFWARVDRSAGPDGCWPWHGACDSKGYGVITIAMRLRKAPQVAWELTHGQRFPAGLWALHACNNPPCVNPHPAHVYPGTPRQNAADREAAGTTPRGERHPFRRHPELVKRGSDTGMSKLTEAVVQAIREAYAAGQGSHRELATRYGVKPTAIGSLLRGHTWRHAGGPIVQNAEQGTINRERTRARGERHPSARLTAVQVQAIRAAYSQGIPMSDLARRYGVRIQSISAAVQRRSWAHIP